MPDSPLSVSVCVCVCVHTLSSLLHQILFTAELFNFHSVVADLQEKFLFLIFLFRDNFKTFKVPLERFHFILVGTNMQLQSD